LRGNNYDKWLKINLLSEVARGHNFSFSGTSFAIISMILHVVVWKISLESLKNYDEFIKSDMFEEVFYFAWKMELISRYGNSNWANVRLTMMNKSSQYLYFVENIKSATILNEYKEKKIVDWFLDDKYNDTILDSEPIIDHYIVYSGLPTNTKNIEKYKKSSVDNVDKLEKFISTLYTWGDLKNRDFNFKKYLDNDSIYDNMIDNLAIINLKMIELYKKLLEKWDDNHLVVELIDSLNCMRLNINILDKISNFAEDFKINFMNNRSSKSENIWIAPIYSWTNGGGYVVLTKRWISRDTIKKSIADIKSEYPNAEIEFCWYEDGYSSDPVMIEQYISKWVYSDFVKEWSVEYMSNYHSHYIWDYNDIIKTETHVLLLDWVWNKVYFNGVKLTSKEIPSNSMVVEVLSKIVFNKNYEISNSELNHSSYSTNRNDMAWKVILPLIRFLETNTNENFPLTCSWSLTKFNITLGKTNIKIWVIKEI